MSTFPRAVPDLQPGVPSEAEVVRRVLAGEKPLFEVLMRRHNAQVYRAVRAVLRNESEIEDVMQQTYLAAFSHLGQFKGDAAFATWLTRIAVREAIGRLRGLHPVDETNAAPDSSSDDPGVLSAAEERLAARELIGVLEVAIDRLPENQRTVFMLREVNGLGTAEVATCLGLTEDAVKVRLHRAKAGLRADLDARLDNASGHAFPFHAPRCDRVVAAVMAKIS